MDYPLVVFLLFLASFLSAFFNYQVVKEKKEKEAARLGLPMPQVPFKRLAVVFAGVVLMNMAILSFLVALVVIAVTALRGY